jgi:hypothetical protein
MLNYKNETNQIENQENKNNGNSLNTDSAELIINNQRSDKKVLLSVYRKLIK